MGDSCPKGQGVRWERKELRDSPAARVWGGHIHTSWQDPLPPSSPVEREGARPEELRAGGAGQAPGTLHMAPAFQCLCTARPQERQWTEPGLRVCSLRVGREPEWQGDYSGRQLSTPRQMSELDKGWGYTHSAPASPVLTASWGMDTICSSPHLERMEEG